MREIKFRGKSIKTGEWIYGYYYEKAVPLQCFDEGKEEKPKGFIIYPGFADWNMPRSMYEAEVIPETVGQYTGLKDKSGKEIYEDDILGFVTDTKWIVGFKNGAFTLYYNNANINILYDCFIEYEEITHLKIIGNIHDNPELLKEGE